jgi:hypothetical protein
VLLAVEDLTSLAVEEHETAVELLVRAEAECPFSLAAGPVLRLLLARLGEGEHILLLVVHHIVVDQWSMGVFARELSVLYEAFRSGRPSPLPELAVQYTDFATWQRNWLCGEVLESELSWWRDRLADSKPVALPTNQRGEMGSAGASESLLVTEPLASSLDALSRRQGVTLSMILLAAFAVLLAELTGQPDLLVASPVANRNTLETEPLIGFFANTLVLRINTAGNPTFTDLLAMVRETSLGAFMHQDLPFDVLVETLGREAGMTRQDYFRVGFNMQNAPEEPLNFPDLHVEPFGVAGPGTVSDLMLGVTQDANGILCRFLYRETLFDRLTACEFVQRFQRLLAEVAESSDLRLSELAMHRDALRSIL